MSVKTADKRFALVASNNELAFPYQKPQKSTGRYGFALTAPGERDREGGGRYTLDIEEVVKHLVFDGWSVRATTINRTGTQRAGSFGLGKDNFVGYWIADELKHLVNGARISPTQLPSMGSNRKNLPLRVLPLPQVDIESDTSHPALSIEIGEAEAGIDSVLIEMSNESKKIELEYANKPGEDVDAVVKRRIGQGPFRTLLEKENGVSCWLSGLDHRQLLIASHIVPWSKSTPSQKTDHANGLLLSVSWDALFDKGLVSFDDDGKLLRNELLEINTMKCLGVAMDVELPSNLLTEKRKEYLTLHRKRHGFVV